MNQTTSPSRVATWMLMGSLVMDNKAAWRDVVVAETGIPFSRFRALRRLERRPLKQSALAALLGIDAPATSVIVGELEADGLAVRTTDADDRRAKLVELTPAGRALVQRVRDLPDEVAAPLAALDDDEVATLHRLLERLHEGVAA